MKSYTDLSQSRNLAEILPIESADMEYLRLKETNAAISSVPFVKDEVEVENSAYAALYEKIPCWSLAALLELLELPTLEKNGIGKGKTGWMVTHYDVSGMRYDTTYHDNPIDACVSMIELLHGLKLL